MRIRVPFAVKIAVSMAVLAMLSLSVFAYLSYRQQKAMIMDTVAQGLTATVRNCASVVDGREVRRGSPEDIGKLVDLLDVFDLRNPDVREFRIITEAGGRMYVLIASQGRLRAKAGMREEYKADRVILDSITGCMRQKKACSTGLYADSEGQWISAFAPIVDTEGQVVGVLAVDREAAEVRSIEARSITHTVVSIAAALAAAALVGIYVSIRMTRPIRRLYAGSTEAREGRFKPIETTGTDEIATLMRDFNDTNAALLAKMKELELLNKELEQRIESRTEQLSKSYEDLREKQQIIQREMTVARRVQETIIPKSVEREKISVDVEYVPIQEIGGDVGIIVEHAVDRFDVVVGDVTGHGMGAALVVNRAHMLLSQIEWTRAPFDALFHRLDYLFAKEIADIGIFMTIMACRFDLAAMTVEYGGGGHPPAIHYRPSEDRVTSFESRCGILGTGNPWCDEPPVATLAVKSGDFVVLFTDGLSEATNMEGEQFGREKLEETVRKAARNGGDGKTIARSLTEATKDFTGGYFQDDVLVLVVSIK